MIPKVRIRRRHRRTAVWIPVLFALSQLAIGAAIDARLPSIRDPEYAIKKRRLDAKIAEAPNRPLTLILGSSRAGHGFRAADLSDADRLTFNFAIPASGPLMLRQTWRWLERDGIRPDRAIVEILPLFFNSATGVRQEDRMLDSAWLSLGEYRAIRPGLSRPGSADRRWLFARLLPIRRHRSELRDGCGPDEFSEFDRPGSPLDWMDGFGWQARPVPPEDRPPLLALAHRQYDSLYPHFVADEPELAVLRDLIDSIRATGCTVTLVAMPEGTEFRRLAGPEAAAALDGRLRELAASTHSRLIDARDWMADGDFYDGHHLLADGAAAMTQHWKRLAD